MSHHIIHIHAEASPKPETGAPCNGCGLCCLWEPCPLGVVLSGRRHGACVAVRWVPEMRQYRCAAVTEPADLLRSRWSTRLHGLIPWASAALARLAKRWIAAGQGCDSTLEWSVPGQTDDDKPLAPTIKRTP
jgi:hypothetical protein